MPIGLAMAQARLANLSRGSLARWSQDSYDETMTGLLSVGPLGAVPGLSRQVTVSFLDLATRPGQAVLGMRWQARGVGGSLFPTLDANLVLTADGPDATVLRIEGAYRPPLGALGARLDQMVLHRVATATIRGFVNRVADAVLNPVPETPEASLAPCPPPEPEAL